MTTPATSTPEVDPVADLARFGRALGPQRMNAKLTGPLASAVVAALSDWDASDKIARLWRKDASLWTGRDEAQWLGWLDVVAGEKARLDELQAFVQDVRQAGFAHCVLMGMGGSSLAPEVLRLVFGRIEGAPEFHVLDSTDPQQVGAIERRIDLAKTLFVVASKSGSTLEPNLFKQYFFELTRSRFGAARAGQQFVAITDPGSKLQRIAEQDGFRRIFFGLPSIGGRYSALSAFGLVNAAVLGIDVAELLARAEEMVAACGPSTRAADNPGVHLGVLLGCTARQGRDKLTILTSARVRPLGAWLEQLVAESTGKLGRAIVPVDLEDVGAPSVYGADRVFAYVTLAGDADADQARAVDALEAAGHPVLRFVLRDAYDLAPEFFRWEIATAVAGSLLGIHPFDQPDVEASKVETRKLSEAFEREGRLPSEAPALVDQGLKLFTDERNERELESLARGVRGLVPWLCAHLSRVRPGDYVALLAYVESNATHAAALQACRMHLRDRLRVATCLGFGPRFLHSTGQAYKGGPNTGVILQITCDDSRDLALFGQKATFGVIKGAQARGDFAVLAERGRRALRVHLGKDVAAGLVTLERALREAVG
jgi:transaldolase/glucose-6-phosphate isomerase